MAANIKFERLILSMEPDELEKFCRDWTEKKEGYVQVKRLAGSGDMGRDVVGFLTDQKHDGAWDNYQCKQYVSAINRSQGLLAIGKVLYWAWKGNFSAPRKFYLVAPQGIARRLELVIDKPSELKKALLDEWDATCSKSITRKVVVPLEPELRDFIEAYDFKNVSVITLDDMMADPAVKPLLIEKYGADPGKYPAAAVPPEVQSTEMPYIDELVEAYSERGKTKFSNHTAVLSHSDYGSDLKRQRERFLGIGRVNALRQELLGSLSPFASVCQRNDRVYAQGEALLFPVIRYFIRQHFEPFGMTSRYKPSPSVILKGFCFGWAFLHALSVSFMDAPIFTC